MENNNITVRQAELSDAEEIALLRCRCIHTAYKGFLSADFLKKIDKTWLVPDTVKSFASCGIDLLYHDKEPMGYIIYRQVSAAPDAGEIVEIGTLPECDTHEMYELASGAIRRLQEKGVTRVITWVLKDNLRLRFQMELFGFRREYATNTVTFENVSMLKQKYVYYMT